MDNTWLLSAFWMGLAFISALISVKLAISVALVEIVIGAAAGNWLGLESTLWTNYLAGVGAVILTCLAGAEVDPDVVRKNMGASIGIGLAGFIVPFVIILLFAHCILQWSWPQAQIAGLSLSTTSVAVVYAVMTERGLNDTELGKIILAACFINDLGTVLALGVIFANYNLWLILFVVVTGVIMWLLPKVLPLLVRKAGNRVSEAEIKFILVILFLLGGLSGMAKSEAVLPAYLIGMVLAPLFLREKVLAQRMRTIVFTMFTPFYFLKAGALVKAEIVVCAAGLIGVLLLIKMMTKFIGVWPLTGIFKFSSRNGVYTTLMMCTGLTFGTICALFGINHRIIGEEQYTMLVTAVIASAVVPTLIAQRWFYPEETQGKERINERV